MFTAGLEVATPELFPARSDTEAVAVRAAPSPVMVLLAGQVPSMPDRPGWSAHVQATLTLLLYQPKPLGPAVGAPDRVGGVLSILMPDTVVLALLSALSVAVPTTDWLAPSVLLVTGAHELLRPEARPPSTGAGSAQAKLTITSPLFQPLMLAPGERDAEIVGG